MKGYINMKQGYMVYTPAKINIRLNILKKLANGLHQVKMDMIPIDLCDQLFIYPAKSEIWKEKKYYQKSDEIIIKTLEIFSNKIKKKLLLDFRLVKNIPYQAGLGGSSGNAAGLLNILSKIYLFDICSDIIKSVAKLIGNDVMFFLNPMAVIASGTGMDLVPLKKKIKSYSIIIYKPPFSISTNQAYQNCIPKFNLDWPNLSDLFDFPPTVNQFWNKNLPYFKQLKELYLELSNNKQVSNALLTGSGSSIIIFFKSKKIRDSFIQSEFVSLKKGRFYLVNSLNKFNYKISKFNHYY